MNLPSLVIEPAADFLPACPDKSVPGVNVWTTAEGQLCAFSSSEGERHSLHWPGVASFRFTAKGDVVTAIPYRPARPDIIRTTFYHSVLPLALQALGSEGVHASAVLTKKGVVGFCGKAQTGKSTLAYALARRGFTPWSDDALVWEMNDGRPAAIPLPFETRLRAPTLSFFGHATIADVPPPHGNRVAGAPVTAIYVMSRIHGHKASGDVLIDRLAGGAALTTLLDHAHCFNPYNEARKRQMVVNYLALLATVPVYGIRFHPSLAFLPSLVNAVVGLIAD